jgi:dCTP diphosphatase
MFEESGPEETEPETEEYMDLERLKSKVKKFVRERDWEKYHTPKDLAIAIAVEAGELLENFQWMKENETERIKGNEDLMGRIESELADVINHCLSMANVLDIDLAKIVLSKLKEAERKYPKEKYRGVWDKPEGDFS